LPRIAVNTHKNKQDELQKEEYYDMFRQSSVPSPNSRFNIFILPPPPKSKNPLPQKPKNQPVPVKTGGNFFGIPPNFRVPDPIFLPQDDLSRFSEYLQSPNDLFSFRSTIGGISSMIYLSPAYQCFVYP
jgi:hypothetical protein